MSDDQKDKQPQPATPEGKTDAGPHQQQSGATKPSAPGETGTTPGTDWK